MKCPRSFGEQSISAPDFQISTVYIANAYLASTSAHLRCPTTTTHLQEGLHAHCIPMSRRTRTRPTLLQSNLNTIILVSLSVLISPITLLVALTCYTLSLVKGKNLGGRRSSVGWNSSRKTILVTGARANKALTLIRAFRRDGHRVIAADEEGWGEYAISRFSRAVDSYHLLADSHLDSGGYIAGLKSIIANEQVDVWIPSSSVQATMVDAEAAKQIRLQGIGGSQGCECFIPEPIVAGTLHWKDQFETLLRDLRLPIPDSKIATSVSEAIDFLYSPDTLVKGHRYLLKCLTLDDLGRDDFTLFPLATREETEHHLSHIPTPLSKKDPFLLQQYLHGPEYCTHVAARDSRIIAFAACRSNQLLMRYADVANLGEQERHMGWQLEKWSQRILDSYKTKLEDEGKTGREYELTGHFSFDFIYEVNERTLYVLECNVVSLALFKCFKAKLIHRC